MSASGNVFNIQRFSIHDGPGIRTTVFLKGCTLACFWCHNPEGRHTYPEIQFFPERCITCGECVWVCPHSAHEIRDGVHVFHRDLCQNHGACAEACCAQALQLAGQVMSVAQVMEEVLRDRPFYESSGGGVTLSGGEPSLSSSFALEILKQCKNHHLSIFSPRILAHSDALSSRDDPRLRQASFSFFSSRLVVLHQLQSKSTQGV